MCEESGRKRMTRDHYNMRLTPYKNPIGLAVGHHRRAHHRRLHRADRRHCLCYSLTHNSPLPLAITCCTLPFLIAYGILVLPMLAVGVARYLDSGESAEFYRFGELFAVVRDNVNVTLQWLILAFIVNLILGLVAIIPCCGWIAVMGLAYPVQGHLLGQYVLELGGKAKRKRDGFYY
jgi:uncharacterized membrane protein YhaH (DUF805 family)